MKTLTLSVLIFLVSFFLFGLTVRGVSGNPLPTEIKNNLDQAGKPLELSPERGRYVLILSLAENKSFSLSPVLADAADPDIGYYKGNYFIYFGPGISILALPFYSLGKLVNLAQVFSFLTISFFAALNIVCLYLIGLHILKFKWWIALVSAVVFGFCSPAWSYANTLYQHHVTTFIILSGVYSVWQYSSNKSYSWIWLAYVWISYGYSIFIDYPNAILIAPVVGYAFYASILDMKLAKEKAMLTFRLAFVLTSVFFIGINIIHGYYNATHFGSWKKLSGGLIGIKEIKRYKLLSEPNPEAAIARLAGKKSVAKFFQEKAFFRGVSILLFSRDRGLFLFAPIFVLGVWGMCAMFKKALPVHYVFLSILGVHVFLYGSWGDPWGGWAFGPRYLIPSMSILSLYVGYWFKLFQKYIWARIFLFILAGYSSAIGLIGALTTNAIPPKIEADYLKMNYNFLRNYQFLIDNHSSSYFFNEYLKQHIALPQFYAVIWTCILLGIIGLTFIIPMWEKHR